MELGREVTFEKSYFSWKMLLDVFFDKEGHEVKKMACSFFKDVEYYHHPLFTFLFACVLGRTVRVVLDLCPNNHWQYYS